MDPSKQQEDNQLTSDCKKIQSLIKLKRLKLSDQIITNFLTFIDVQQYWSAALIQQIRNLRDLLLKQTSNNNHPTYSQEQHLRANTYLSLAITSEILKNGRAESEYRIALSYDQKHPQINLSLALILYHRQQYREALKYISKVTVKTAFTEKHRENIWNILISKVENRICQQLSKTNNSEQHIAKVQFIRKVMKFKEAFLYRSAQIQSLSQESYAQLAQLLFYTNRFADSLTLTYKLRNLNQPPTQEIQQSLAILFFLFSKFEESAECAKQGLRINPRNQQIHKYLIQSLILLQQIPKAKVCAMGLINLNKYNSSAYQLMGAILSIQGSKQLGLEYSKLGVVIQPSEQTYSYLALQFSESSIFAQAQRCYLKSIKIKPNELNYSSLGVLYFQNNAHLNAMLCFFESITHNFLQFEPYLYLGICAKRNTFLRSVINRFMAKLKSAHTQDPFLQTNLAVYKFISNQSHKQMYAFLSNFMEERKKGGEETLYGDIANQIIRLGLPKYIIKENIIFWLIFGVLCRAKEHFIQANQIFAILIAQQASVNGMSLSFAFTSLYQSQISKTPKALQPIFLQFIIAEMVQSSPAQALKCFHKSLSYAEGDYQQFYAEFYKIIERDIEQLWPISIIANSVVDRQPLDYANEEYVSEAMDKHSFIELGKYTQRLGVMAQMVNALSQQSSKGHFWKIHQFLPILMGGNIIRDLDLNVKQPRKVYGRLFDQIKNDQETVVKNIQELFSIYSRKGEIKHLKTKICNVMELYFDRFIVNQKVKLIFNHFHPYIITESCHKQFAVILHRIKECAQFIEYSPWELMEDLQNMFREGNKHTNKVFKVEYGDRNQELIQDTSEMESSINYPWIGLDLQTRSKVSTFYEEEHSFCQWDYQKTKRIHKSPESSTKSSVKEDQLKFRAQNQIKVTKKKAKINIQAIKKKHEDNSDEQQSSSDSQVPRSSSQSLQTLSDQQVKWYQLSYSPHKTKFHNWRKYGKFNELLHRNTCCLIKCVSQQSNLKYVAKHICSSKISKDIFDAKVQHGYKVTFDNKGVRGGEQLRTLQWIQTLGPTHVLRWIADIALGICELEDLGIYHTDLYFRNTIKVSKGNSFSFKIIDFDKAFKVHQTDKRDEGYQCTRDLFDFWLRFRFAGKHSKAPIYFYSSSKSSKSGQQSYEAQDVIEYMFVGAEQSLVEYVLSIKQQSIFQHQKRISKCISLLKEHMRGSHLKQFSQLVQQLLSSPQGEKPQIQTQKADEVLQELRALRQGKIGYYSFAERVKSIGGLEEREEDDSQECILRLNCHFDTKILRNFKQRQILFLLLKRQIQSVAFLNAVGRSLFKSKQNHICGHIKNLYVFYLLIILIFIIIQSNFRMVLNKSFIDALQTVKIFVQIYFCTFTIQKRTLQVFNKLFCLFRRCQGKIMSLKINFSVQ